MVQSAHDAYLESRVLSADPVELVKMLYEAAIAAVKDARQHLANRDILARARAITKACTIVTELTLSLDHERGGEVSNGLARLYDYIGRRLIEANFKQADQPLEEVLGLLSTLAEGWEGVQPGTMPEPRAVTPEPLAPEPEPRAASPNPWAANPEPWTPEPELDQRAPSPWAPPPSDTQSKYTSHAWSF